MTSTPHSTTKPSQPVWPAPVALAATGAGAVAMAPLTADPTLCQRAGFGGVLLAAGLSLSTARRSRRRELMASLSQALAATIGHPSRTELTASRWRGGFVGAPSRLSIRWSPESRSNDPGWASQVTAIAASQLGVPLEVVKLDPPKNKMWLRIPSKTVTPEMHVDQQRAERNVLKLLGPTSKIVDVENTDGLITRIRAEHQDATRFATSGHRARIERTLTEVMPGRWRGVWQLEKDTVTFEVRPTLPDVVWMPAAPVGDLAAMLTEYSRLKIPVAVDEDGQVLFWQPKTVPQGLIVGGTGSGKTSTAHALVAEITRHDFPIWISDAKRIEFLAFRDWPNVQMVATTIEQQVALVWRVLQLMEQRLELVEHGRAKLSDFQPLFVILDEFAEMRDNLLDWYPGVKPEGKNVDRHPPTLKQVARIARLARSVRIHLVVLIQRPDAAFLGGEMRDNFGFRVSMGRLSPQGAMMMWENASTGVTLPRDKTGRCMAMGSTPRPVEAQAYRFPDMESDPKSEEGLLLEELRPATTRHERYLFTPVEEARDLAGADPQKDPDFWDYARVPLVRASDRPDLDPLLADPGVGEEFGEDIGSPSLLLGITTPGPPVIGEGAPARQVETFTDEDPLEQYLEPEQADVERLTAGTLVLVDENQDHWAVLESEPVDDLEDGSVCLFWRDFDGEEGILCLGRDDELTIRPPRFDEDLGQPLPGEN